MDQDVNIPIDIIRTLIVISETGSISKAADRLNLSQPALSSQVRRIQGILGAEVFRKTPNGSVPTEMGLLVIEHGRRIIEANDQILRIGGRNPRQQPIRIGLTNLYVQELLNCLSPHLLSNIIVQGGSSVEVAKGISEGYIDIGCFFASEALMEPISHLVVNEAEEAFVWCRSKNFVLSPGAPVPLLSHPGTMTDDLMIRALAKKGTPYRIAFNSADNLARIKAAERGIGITAYPARFDCSPLIQAREYYLPALPPLKAVLCARQDFHDGTDLLRTISSQFFQSQSVPTSTSAAI